MMMLLKSYGACPDSVIRWEEGSHGHLSQTQPSTSCWCYHMPCSSVHTFIWQLCQNAEN